MGFWYALEDATLENGCLSFLPGSHKYAPIEKRLVRKQGNTGTEMVDNDGPRFPPGESYGVDKPAGLDDANYVPGEVKAGDCMTNYSFLNLLPFAELQWLLTTALVVLIHGNLLHKSEKKYVHRILFPEEWRLNMLLTHGQHEPEGKNHLHISHNRERGEKL